MFYEKKGMDVQCNLCPHNCLIFDGKRGLCNVRENKGGKLYSLVYEKAISAAVDPIEKKPFFHFMPGSYSYSISTMGCNLKCDFCQNWEISQADRIIGKELSADKIIKGAITNNCSSIAYTYTEPTIFFEYSYDIAKLASKKGLKNLFVTNGFINKEPIDKIAKYLDAANVDLKGFSDSFYKKNCCGRLEPVLSAIKEYYKKGVFLEITTLIVPGQNDSLGMLKDMALFIASVDKNIPWHISRFYPHYNMLDVDATSVDIIHKAIKIGKDVGLKYIYSGNISGDDYESTYCWNCGKKIISRIGFEVQEINLDKDKCKYCGKKIDIIN